MAGKGLSSIRPPKPRHSLKRVAGFDTVKDKVAEDKTRARLLRRAARRQDRPLAVAFRALADSIDPAKTKRPGTIASARYMRRLRIRIIGELWRLHDLHGGELTRFDLLPSGLTFDPEQLAELDPRRLIRMLRSALNRAGAGRAGGFALLALHGEYDPVTNLFHLHFHGYGQGEMLRVVHRLRKQRRYERLPIVGGKGETRPVRFRRKPLTNVPTCLTYLFQSWWPSRSRKTANGEKVPKSPPRRRIPEPAHSIYLAWLNKWRLEDMTLLVNLRVVKGRLQIRHRSSAK